MFIEVLCGLHWWLYKHLSGIPFPATLDQEHQGVTDAATSLIRWWQMQQLPWFAVSSVECWEYEHCRRFVSHTPRNKNSGVSDLESAIFSKSLGEWASPLIRCARNCLPSLPPLQYLQFHQPRGGKLGEFVFHLTPVSCVCRVSFQQYNHLKPHHDFRDTLYFISSLLHDVVSN
jgi:hypothetical protein